MNTKEQKELAGRLAALALFRPLLADPVVAALAAFLNEPDPGRYAAFAAALYQANGGDLTAHLARLCFDSENAYVRLAGAGRTPPDYLRQAMEAELDTLERVCALGPDQLLEGLAGPPACPLPRYAAGAGGLAARYLARAADIGRWGYGIYAANRMFVVDGAGAIAPVKHPDPIALADLVDYAPQRAAVLANTRALLAGRPAANILLTGDAGTGKSSTVKAVANELFGQGLRVVEVRKDQLRLIPRLLAELAENPLKFILFIDDLSFVRDDDNFSALKAVLEGSVAARSRNVVIYATSNRRHLVKERFSDREGDDVHRADTLQELVSLSERFGMHITFSRPDKATYLHIVRHLAAEAGLRRPADELEQAAERFALARGGRSARLARQFVDSLLAKG